MIMKNYMIYMMVVAPAPAVVAGVVVIAHGALPGVKEPRARTIEDTRSAVCHENESDTLSLPCGHLTMCQHVVYK